MLNISREGAGCCFRGRAAFTALACAIAAFAILGPASQASALGLIPLSVERSVFAEGTELCGACGLNGNNPTSASEVTNCELELFDETAESIGSTAMQTSILSQEEFSGSGKITLGNTNSNSAHSSLLVHFEVEQTGLFGLRGEFMGQADINQMSLRSEAGLIFDRQSSGPEQFSESFVLEAGQTYTYEVKVWDQDFTRTPSGGGWAFAFVPEPTTGLLMGLGLTALFVSRRERQVPSASA